MLLKNINILPAKILIRSYAAENRMNTRYITDGRDMFKLANRILHRQMSGRAVLRVTRKFVGGRGYEKKFHFILLQTLLMNTEVSCSYRFDLFKVLVDNVDLERERSHLIMPFIASGTSFEKLSILFRAKLMGYKDLVQDNLEFLAKHIVLPELEHRLYNDLKDTDIGRLDKLFDRLKSFGIREVEILDLFKTIHRFSQRETIYVSSVNLTRWIEIKSRTVTLDDEYCKGIVIPLTNQRLRGLIAADNVQKLHVELIKNGGFPKDTDFSKVVDEIIVLYLEQANFGYLHKLLHMLSQATEPEAYNDVEESSKNPHNFVENFHLLHILHRKFIEIGYSGDLSVLDEYAKELRLLFPRATADPSTLYQTVGAYRTLFKALLHEKTLTKELLDKVINFFDGLVRQSYLNLHTNETISPYIVRRVLNILGWNTAVETWLKLQEKYHLSNGMLELLIDVLTRQPVDCHRKNFILQKARSDLSESRVNAFLAIAYVQLQKYDEAEAVLSENKLNPMDLAQLFRLNNSIQTAKMGHEADVTYEFLKICLNSTNLKNDQNALKVCHADWIRMCTRNDLGVHAMRIKELLDDYGVKLDDEFLNRVKTLARKHNQLVDKWILDPKTNLLNSKLLDGSKVIEHINEFKKRTEEVHPEVELNTVMT
ncbi:unnamed protein product [Bursaphelenchus okinawaensis]|uniref:Uncharacterized protein n=1 Tax=Bursaphelenchus okinawaensis TaxID=465554 RepID=A0A811L6A5_9BILA|nr:unnamed protein product [Bursaphelenchus okinawaensis]CAG9118866.1 unnamed protein product [Bursaphelenchus okinawaensis]